MKQARNMDLPHSRIKLSLIQVLRYISGFSISKNYVVSCSILFSFQFIVVSLKDGMFNNANVLFRTKFVDGMSTVSRTVNKVK